MIGPGRYDALTEHCIKETHADCVVLIVMGGDKGSGMSVSVDASGKFEVAVQKLSFIGKLPAILREIADHIEKDAGRKH